MTLHDWIDELCDALDIDAEVDEGIILDVARDAAHAVERVAAPISTFLLGYATALAGGSPQKLEELATRAIELAEGWGGRKDALDEIDVEVPDDDLVDID